MVDEIVYFSDGLEYFSNLDDLKDTFNIRNWKQNEYTKKLYLLRINKVILLLFVFFRLNSTDL